MNQLDVPAYPAADIVAATGVAYRTLKHWHEDRVIGADKPTAGTGNFRRLSMRSVYRIALATALVRCGVRPCVAIHSAAEFSDSRNGSARSCARFSGAWESSFLMMKFKSCFGWSNFR
jgi:hypothetical protein